ncbi:MAG: prolyl oligopeptidase family serine peptidase [Verrucomicrobiota bacterium]|nr:prolyl oligopeptidase family serine peptidase [Verrucomicrobiota bacterium]
MKRLLPFLLCGLAVSLDHAAELKTPGDRMFAEYFKIETSRLADSCLAEIETLDDWNAKKDLYRKQLHEMLGLDPLPERTPLQATITGTVQHEEFEVRNLHFQSSPGLYVTGNLYVPKNLTEPAPTILYVCGHGRVEIDGVDYGNKTYYQHHAAWFARNGYVCLVIDTIQLGELSGIHHGTYRHGMWWWNSRGYTPAGVEAWNCIRALDYLTSLELVDKNRLGVTGRSGGGAYSWWIASIDERIKVAAPVAGITDLQNHVVDGVVEGHCDCMYHVNTYGWDFAQVAALVAPRPLLILNTDDDGIFPLDGVNRLFTKVRRIYKLHGKKSNLGLVITPGGHGDSQELRVPAFNWFNKHLKGKTVLIDKPATKLFQPQQLKVFSNAPKDEQTTTIHDTFSRIATEDTNANSPKIMADLRSKTFGGWPKSGGKLQLVKVSDFERDGVRLAAYDFDSQPGIRLRMHVAHKADLAKGAPVHLQVLNDNQVEDIAGQLEFVAEHPGVYVALSPRGVGPTRLTQNQKHLTQTRRRFMLLGQTLAGQQVWDVRRCIRALRTLERCAGAPLELWGTDDSASLVTLASLFEKEISRLNLSGYPASDREQPDFLNISRFATTAQLLDLAKRKTEVKTLDQATNFPGEKTAWHNFDRYDFKLGDGDCRVVTPNTAAPGRPWVWRARFWGHEPQADLALLAKGWHVVYCEVGALFGSPAAVERWDRFYDFLTTQHGFATKAALEGMSRGGLIIYNWAASNPGKVAAIYGDAPVCDFKSWPAGRGVGKGSLGTWKQCLAAYGFTEAEAVAYKGNPIDRLAPLAKAGIPILHVVGDADKVVPITENSDLIEKRYKVLGGKIHVIHKPGVGHHPHSLKDPEPIVKFFLAHAPR